MDLWPVSVRARRSLVETFEPAQWKVRSLTEGWTAREVLAHLILAARPSVRRYLLAVARARGSFDRANHRLAVTDSQQLIARLPGAYDHSSTSGSRPRAGRAQRP